MKEIFGPWSNGVSPVSSLLSIETLYKAELACAVWSYRIKESWFSRDGILIQVYCCEVSVWEGISKESWLSRVWEWWDGFKSGPPSPWPQPSKSKCCIFAIPSANCDQLWQISRDDRWQIWILPRCAGYALPGRSEPIARWLPRIYCRHSI